MKKCIEGCQWSTWLNLVSLLLTLLSTGYLAAFIVADLDSQLFQFERLNVFLSEYVWEIAIYLIVTVSIYLLFTVHHRKHFQLAIKFSLEVMPSLRGALVETQETKTKKLIYKILHCQNQLIDLGGLYKFYMVILFWGLVPIYFLTNTYPHVDEWSFLLVVITLLSIGVTQWITSIKQARLFRVSQVILGRVVAPANLDDAIGHLDSQRLLGHYRMMVSFMILTWLCGIVLAFTALQEVGKTMTGMIQAWHVSVIEIMVFFTLLVIGYFLMQRPLRVFKQKNQKANRPVWLFAEVIANPKQHDTYRVDASKFIQGSFDHMREMDWSIHLFIKLQFFLTFPLLAFGCMMSHECSGYLSLTYVLISLAAMKFFESFYVKLHNQINDMADQQIKELKIVLSKTNGILQ